MIRFACPGCQATFTVDDSKGGKAGTCPKCQARFLIPEAEPGAAASPPPPSRPPAPPADPNEPVEISPCPKCGTRLSVSPSDLGSDVECPYCQTVFAAKKPGGSAAAPPPPPKPPRKSGGLDFGEADHGSGSRRRPADEDEDRPRPRRRRDEDDEEEEDRPRRRPAAEDDGDEDRPRRRRRDYDEDEEDDRPRRRRGGRRAAAEASVAAPAIFLMVVGILGILVGLANVALQVSGFNDNPNNNPFVQKQQVNQPGFQAGHKVGGYMGAFLSLIWGGIVTAGAFKMKSLSGHGAAVTGAIFAILPCNPCCLLGIVAGIWSLVVLFREDVKDAFT